VRDEYVIVEPRTHKIVDVIEHSGGGRAASTTTTTKSKVNLSQKDRAYIREHATTRRTTTTGSASRGETRITVGEDAPEAAEIESFPTEVYREVPAVRTYRYIHRGDDIYLVEPGSRRVIESIGED
jgi:guanyl-specific ribonuclease Sa